VQLRVAPTHRPLAQLATPSGDAAASGIAPSHYRWTPTIIMDTARQRSDDDSFVYVRLYYGGSKHALLRRCC